ncbi:MAG: MaoC family dehydratase N-terminal domain-containing protein [Nocardiaceae bacterium]|nr:MaoC family dehydratase N-terminal domain-containing protein [Nocardiaceae bacterium]
MTNGVSTAVASAKSVARVEFPTRNAAAMVGSHYRVDDFYEVGREKVREYARAVQDFHPAHWHEADAAELGHGSLLAPLTFISLVGIIAQKRLFEELIHGYDLSSILHTDQVLEFHQPIKVGDRLTCDVYVDSFRQMAGTDIIVTKNLVTNQDGELIQTTFTTLIARSSDDVDSDVSDAVRGVMMHGVTQV